MKLNQFAIQPTDFTTKVVELIRLHFISAETASMSPRNCLHALLRKSFPEAHTTSAADAKLTTLMADTETDAYQLVTGETEITAQMVLNLILQLLGFEAGREFQLTDPQQLATTVHLPTFSQSTLSTDDLLDAWYQLLTTRTVNGQTFLDNLASRGYFQPLIHDPSVAKPLFFNGKAQPVFDTNQLIREVVYVESSQDTDGDGQRDLLKVEITRPRESNTQTVPVLYTASPYNQGTNDEAGEALTHDVNVPLTEKKVQASTLTGTAPVKPTIPAPRVAQGTATVAEETFGNTFDYSLNDYFLARGFAVVYASGIGTKDSDGLRTTGDVQETISTTAVIEWLNGDRPAFTNRTDQTQIDAWWSNRHVAMTGRSYLGTLATAAATTGVPGLKTIICEAGISSWYDYYREGGLVIAPGGFPGEDADVLAEETFSRQKQAGDYHRIQAKWQAALTKMTQQQDRVTGNYNDFWDARNYRKDAAHIKADVMIVHGLNDWNVKPANAEKLWRSISDLPIAKKLVLHQGPHIYINDFQSIDFTDMVNLWLSHELYDLDNHAETLLPDVVIQDNAKPETWTAFSDWGNPANPTQTIKLSDFQLHNQATTTATFADQLPTDTFNHYTHHLDQWQTDLIAADSPLTANRLRFTLPAQTSDLLLDGCPKLTLRVAVDHPVGLISCQLIDLGEFKRLTTQPGTLDRQAYDLGDHFRKSDLREYQLTKHPTPYQLISRGHLNLQNRTQLTQVDTITPGEFYTASLTLQPTHYRLTPGHQLALLIYATDMAMTVRGNLASQYTVQLADSTLTLPYLTK